MPQELLIETIRTDGGTQSRAKIDEAYVAELVETIEAGKKLPPIIVYNDGSDVWMADGFHRILAAMDVFVLASTMEGTSLALMEAMASGTPCVATAVGGTPEIITDGESGLLVSPGDMPSLSNAVLGLLEDDGLREALAQKGRQRIRRDYNVMNSIETILKNCSRLWEERFVKGNRE